MSATTDQVRGLLSTRITELDEEKSRVESALEALSSNGRKAPGRPRRKYRSRRGGNRAEQAVKLIAQRPGITASEIAKAMKIKPNYLYRVLGDLEKEKRVKKDGRKYSPA